MKKDTYGEPTIITKGNVTAEIYSPILTEEEHKRRMNAIKQAVIKLNVNKEMNGNV